MEKNKNNWVKYQEYLCQKELENRVPNLQSLRPDLRWTKENIEMWSKLRRKNE